MSKFPFDTQSFLLRFSIRRAAVDEVVLDDDRIRPPFSTIRGELRQLAGGRRGRTGQLLRLERPRLSRMTFVVTVERSWTRYILRMFVPFLAIMSLSPFILWAPDTVISSNQRAPLVFTTSWRWAAPGSFTFEASFPGVRSR